MDIKIIALDLDGTLLDSKKRLSQENRQALELCCNNGIQIVPTTGRTVSGIPDEIKSIPGIRYAITTNGAVIEDMQEGSALDTRMIDWEKAVEILKLVNQYPVMYDPYIERRGISEPRFYNNLSEYNLNPEIQDMVHRTRDVYPNIIEFVLNNQKPVEKINLFFRNKEERSELRQILDKIDNILITSSMPLNLELNNPEANKGDALLRLAEHLNLKQHQTMAMGDGENDFTMVQMAGIGVAMRNGRPDLLKIADYVTDTNDEHGVASAIYHFVSGIR